MAVALCAAAGSAVMIAAAMPSPVLFGALVGSMAYAVLARRPPSLPVPLGLLGQGVIGVAMGALVDLPTLRELAVHGPLVVVVCLATLAVSLVIGQGLRAHGVSAVTAAFAFIAGGASGIVAMSGELGADDRVVSVVQYLRVLLITAGMPVVTAVVFRPERTGQVLGAAAAGSDWWADLVFLAVALGAGAAIARWTNLPAGSLLGPLLVSLGLAVSGVFPAPSVPGPVEVSGYALVGVMVGLRFTRDSLASIAAMLPTAVGLIVAVVAASAGLGVLLADWTGVSRLDGYLATTPGGLYAVLATAVDTGANVTFVLAVQVARVLVMLLVAPAVAGWFRRSPTSARGQGAGLG
jgi:membrane AbrB-like protein